MTPIERSVRSAVHRLGLAAGVDLVSLRGLRHAGERRARLLRSWGAGLVIDVGANSGQFGLDLRRHGYLGRIVSFEPLAAPFRILAERAHGDPLWDVEPVALGEHDGSVPMHVARNNGASSSVLAMLPLHQGVAPEANYIAVEEVQMRRLDDAIGAHDRGDVPVFLKLDVQGYEDSVLRGGAETLGRVAGLQVELSLAPLYEGAPTFQDMLRFLDGAGFELVGVEPGLTDPQTGRVLQIDGIFARKKSAARS